MPEAETLDEYLEALSQWTNLTSSEKQALVEAIGLEKVGGTAMHGALCVSPVHSPVLACGLCTPQGARTVGGQCRQVQCMHRAACIALEVCSLRVASAARPWNAVWPGCEASG